MSNNVSIAPTIFSSILLLPLSSSFAVVWGVGEEGVGLGVGEEDLMDMLFLLDLRRLEIDLEAETDADEDDADGVDVEEGGGDEI